MNYAPPTGPDIPRHFVSVCCDLCGAPGSRPFLAKLGGFYTRCPQCAFVYANPRDPQPADYNEDNNEAKRGMYIDKQYSRRHQRKYVTLLKKLSSFRQLNRLVEVGCSTGGFCYRACRMGWHATGIEPVAAVAEVGRARHGLDIRCATLEEASFEDNSFDVVFSNAVLEHVPSPTEVLKESQRILRPGGVVFATTVNIASYTWKYLGAEWKLVDPRAHLGLFTPNTLRRFCEKAGLRVLQLSTHGVRCDNEGRRGGLAKLSETVLKFPLRMAARLTSRGEIISVLAQKPAA